MRRRRMRSAAVIAVLVLAGSWSAGARLDARQGLTGVQANWGDLETWSHYIEDARQNELGLGLQPAGPDGRMLIAFLGRLAVRNPRPPAEVRVQVAASALGNPNLVRRATLTFLADGATDRRQTFDLSSRLIVDDPTPGGNLQNGVATMPAADFIRLAEAETLSANIFGFAVNFTSAELAAMREFAESLHLPITR